MFPTKDSRANRPPLDSVSLSAPLVNSNPNCKVKFLLTKLLNLTLSNVNSRLQGFVEDQFGLGLIARAAEEGISIIKPTGRLIFNIGGRPGQAVTERLFSRRGFHINKLWQTRVNQVGFPLNDLSFFLRVVS